MASLLREVAVRAHDFLVEPAPARPGGGSARDSRRYTQMDADLGVRFAEPQWLLALAPVVLLIVLWELGKLVARRS